MVLLCYPESFFSEYASNVRALDEGALAAAAKTYIRPEEIVWIVVGDLAKIEPGVRSLGLGDAVRIEAE
jgi:zinc protease